MYDLHLRVHIGERCNFYTYVTYKVNREIYTNPTVGLFNDHHD